MNAPHSLTLLRPDDWHLHLRDGAALRTVLPFSARSFARAIVMPNLSPPLTTTAAALAYRERIVEALPAASRFEPLMTLYLTDNTLPAEIRRARASGHIHGCKLYPAGATTHSEAGVTDVARIDATLAAMSEADLPLLVHGEVADAHTDIFEREARFIDEVLVPLAERHARLRIVLEHVSTRAGVEFVRSGRERLAATVTPQHLLLNRNALFEPGLSPHLFCRPVLKGEPDRRSLIEAVAAGDPRFFLGTDSAPHARRAKESACGCAGIFSAHAALELYAEIFEREGILDRLAGFASEFGADFYRLPRNSDHIILARDSWVVPQRYPFGDGEELVPLGAGSTLRWRLQSAADARAGTGGSRR